MGGLVAVVQVELDLQGEDAARVGGEEGRGVLPVEERPVGAPARRRRGGDGVADRGGEAVETHSRRPEQRAAEAEDGGVGHEAVEGVRALEQRAGGPAPALSDLPDPVAGALLRPPVAVAGHVAHPPLLALQRPGLRLGRAVGVDRCAQVATLRLAERSLPSPHFRVCRRPRMHEAEGKQYC